MPVLRWMSGIICGGVSGISSRLLSKISRSFAAFPYIIGSGTSIYLSSAPIRLEYHDSS